MASRDTVTLVKPLAKGTAKYITALLGHISVKGEVRVTYSNDVGPGDDGFWEFYEILDASGDKVLDVPINWNTEAEQAKALAEFIAAMINLRTEVAAALALVTE